MSHEYYNAATQNLELIVFEGQTSCQQTPCMHPNDQQNYLALTLAFGSHCVASTQFDFVHM